MALEVKRTMNFGGGAKITGLPSSGAAGEPVVHEQLQAAVEGLGWKDNARVSTQGNINLAAPGASIDGVALVANDGVLVRAQTAAAENGLYVFNGAATPMTRRADGSSFDELESAVVVVDEGTDTGKAFRQTAVNGTLGSTGVTWGTFGTSAAAASESTAGIAEVATQAETDAGTDDARMVSPLKLANSPWAKRKYTLVIGDGSATSFVVTHNLNTRDVLVSVAENAGNYRDVLVEVQRTSLNAVTVLFDAGAAPASNAYKVLVVA